MEKVLEQFNKYKDSPKTHWENRLTWMGLDGTLSKPSTSIMQFNREMNKFEYMVPFYETKYLFNDVKDLANSYVDWVKTKNKGYSEKEYEDMHKFFIGGLGEVFYDELFKMGELNIVDNTGKRIKFEFSNVCPTLKGGYDFGIDFTGIVNGTPSVFQIKFWNPYSRVKIGVDVIQKMYAEGVSRNIIDKDCKNNMFICYLGDEKSVYDFFKKLPNYYGHIVVIGMNTIVQNVDDNIEFWDKFRERLVNLK